MTIVSASSWRKQINRATQYGDVEGVLTCVLSDEVPACVDCGDIPLWSRRSWNMALYDHILPCAALAYHLEHLFVVPRESMAGYRVLRTFRAWQRSQAGTPPCAIQFSSGIPVTFCRYFVYQQRDA